MACTRQGTRTGRTARNGPAALVGDIRRRSTSRVRECACTGSARNDRASTRCWLVLVKVGGTAVAMAQRQQHVHNQGHKQGDGERGSAHDEGLCSHNSWPKKAGPSLDGGVLSVWVPTASRNSACVRRNKGTTQMQGKGARAATTAAAPAKRPARLDDRLSSDGGSARRRDAGQRSSHNQRAHKARSSLGSKAGSTTRSRGFLTSRSWTWRRGGAVK
jgi:hypothetical protein